MKTILFVILSSFIATISLAQVNPHGNDVTTPLHLLQPDYPVPYGNTNVSDIRNTIDRIYNYLNRVTPANLVNKKTGRIATALNNVDTNYTFQQGDFRLISYEWGVTYTGMLLAGEVTGDKKFTKYTTDRIGFIADVVTRFKSLYEKNHTLAGPVRSVLDPRALDDAGSMCAAMIKTLGVEGTGTDVRPIIDNYIDYIWTKEFRLEDGTLARNRPQPNTLWLDDLYMSLPALMQMGKLTGDTGYFTEALKQLKLFSDRMFNREKGLYMHGWVQDMNPHPEFYWARANGWALLTKVEILDNLPEDFPGRDEVLNDLLTHIRGIALRQDGTGFWHQLLDRNDTYLETSATAIYAYCIAHAINKGWIDVKAYGPMALLAWNAVNTKVNEAGQVEGTCVGTGMGFDPAFYYFRPVNKYAAHGYGPVLLAGAEMIRLLNSYPYEINDSSVQFGR